MTCLAVLLTPGAAGLSPLQGAPAHMGGLSTYHLILKINDKVPRRFYSLFLKDDKCIDINIFLVLMATIFKRGWSWLISLP